MLVGLELHQRLDREKLFCRCDGEGPGEFQFKRLLCPRPGAGGKTDVAAEFEALRPREFSYSASREVCLVEMDEEPPGPINQRALKKALAIALHFGFEVFPETVVMRKIVVDGSDVSGFQRTLLLGIDGKIGEFGLQTICLEEESAGKMGQTFDLHRYGIPLVEIATEPLEVSPEKAKEIAFLLGREMRKFGVLRGLGTIRQDLNVSIEGGARVEIKGVQDLALIPRVLELEAHRQRELIAIAEELRERGAKVGKVIGLGKAWKGKPLFGLPLPGFSGLLGKEILPKRRFGTELADYARSAGAGGIIHSDEAGKYGLEWLHEELGRDGWVVVAHPDGAAILEVVRKRAAFFGVPEETRRANPDGTTSFMRPLPGRARMYPETDCPSVNLWGLIQEAKTWREECLQKWEKLGKLGDVLTKLGREAIYLQLLEAGLEEKTLEELLVRIPTTLSREGVQVENEALLWVGKKLAEDQLTLKGAEELLRDFSPERFQALRKITGEELKNLVREYGKEVFKKFRLRVDGKEVFNLLREINSGE